MFSLSFSLNFLKELSSSLPVGLLQASIVSISTLGLRTLIGHLRDKSPGRDLWSLDKSKTTNIIITTGRIRDDEEMTDTVYPAEAKAAAEVESYLRFLYPKMTVRVTTSEAAAGDDLKGNLVVIGGPNHNRIARRILESVSLPYKFIGNDLQKTDGKRWSPLLSKTEDIERDIGLVLRMKNHFSPSGGTLILISGCRTFGCLVGVRSIVRSDVKRTGKALGTFANWVMVVTGEVHKQEVLGIKVSDTSSVTSTPDS